MGGLCGSPISRIWLHTLVELALVYGAVIVIAVAVGIVTNIWNRIRK